MTDRESVPRSTSPAGSNHSLPRFGPSPEYYDHTARGYDEMATTYDRVEGANALSERVRRTTLAAALGLFRPGDRILELGCGTGRDAVSLARHGMRVVATDISAEMVATTRRRAELEGVGHLVRTVRAAAADAPSLVGPCDGVYSNGAVVNLEPDLPRMALELARAVRPGGYVVLTAANRLSLFELGLYPMVLRPRKAFRKLGESVPIPISREGLGRRYAVRTRFLTPKELIGMFREGFVVESLRGLQVISPPWNLVDFADRLRSVVGPLERVEDRLGMLPGLRSAGAIYLCVFRRVGT